MPAGRIGDGREGRSSDDRIQEQERRENGMQPLRDLEIGVMFWAGRDPGDTLRELKAIGVRCGQIGIAGDFPLNGAAAGWKAALHAEDFPVVTAFCAYNGESYADIPTVKKTVGFVPDDDSDIDYMAVRGMVRRVCDYAAKNKQTFALETGQEPADSLQHFFIDVNRENLRINFDPANMILYGTGDPIEALGVLAEHVVSVHCKDGDWPPKGVPGALG